MCDTLSILSNKPKTELYTKENSNSPIQDLDVCGNLEIFISRILHPFDDYNTRLESFKNWPKSSPSSKDLAASGFYYKGIGDKTVCFHCSGPLNNWDDCDNPWEQHALWYPKCKFVLNEKGLDFVQDVQKKMSLCQSDFISDETKLKDEDLCIICSNRKKDVVFVPCGHNWTCLECTKGLEDKKCPVCRTQIINVL